MTELEIDKIGLQVGLEIHQQLSTNKKLFCNCSPIESDEYSKKISRKLRASKSEFGKYDPAALFEKSKSKTFVYYSNPKSSCLVEEDEEPPHEIEDDAKKIALVVASALKSNIFTEIYPMRKLVIDGSNTSGFQRTMLVSVGGHIQVNGKEVGVQSICLEEDSAKLLGDKDEIREYSLDRLGIPLVEIALAPVSGTPAEVKEIALSLGRLLRTTKKVTRGLGSIRQDVNVSIKGGGVIEVKGVQQLEQLEKVIEYEAKRQHGLLLISQKLQGSNFEKISKTEDVFVISDIFKSCKSKIIQKAIKENSIIKVIRIKKFHGMFGFSPYEGIRLGKELGQLVRFFGIGGVFHSDELPNYGIESSDIDKVNNFLKIGKEDGFLIIAAEKSKIDFAIDAIINRLESATIGVPAETRLALPSGETVFLRPRPGASRMYPETDIPPITISPHELDDARNNIPKSWDESLKELQTKYQLNFQLALQIFDSDYLDLFEKICENKKNSPNFVASTLCSTITNLQRKGLDRELLDNHKIILIFDLLVNEKISKESLEMIFEQIMSGKEKTVENAIQKLSISNISDDELDTILDDVIQKNTQIIENQGEHSIGPLMGTAMKSTRGKASGEKINQILKKKIQDYLDNKN